MKYTPRRNKWVEPMSPLMHQASTSLQISREDEPMSRRLGLDRAQGNDSPAAEHIVSAERPARPVKRSLWENSKENPSLNQSKGFLQNITHHHFDGHSPFGLARNEKHSEGTKPMISEFPVKLSRKGQVFVERNHRQAVKDEERTLRGRSRPIINPDPLYSERDQIDSSENQDTVDASDSGWGTEADEVKDRPIKHGKDISNIFLEQAHTLIDQVGESWKLAFDEGFNSIKTDFKNIALHVETLLSNDAILANALGQQLEISMANEKNLRDKLIEASGEALEAAVQVQATLNDLQKRFLEITRGIEKKKQEFMRSLSDLKRFHSEGIEKLQTEMAAEAESYRPRIQAAKSSKLEQMDNQRQLAKILAGN